MQKQFIKNRLTFKSKQNCFYEWMIYLIPFFLFLWEYINEFLIVEKKEFRLCLICIKKETQYPLIMLQQLYIIQHFF